MMSNPTLTDMVLLGWQGIIGFVCGVTDAFLAERQEYPEMNVTHYTQAHSSGDALYVFHLVRAVARQGVTVRLVCPNDYEHLYRLAMTENLQVYKLPQVAPLHLLGGRFGKAYKLWQLLKQTAVGTYKVRALRRESPIVHANFPQRYPIAALMLIGFKLSGVQLIYEAHDVLPHRSMLPWAVRFLDWVLFWGMYVAADKIIVHHREGVHTLRKKFGVRPGKVVVIPHGPFRLSDAPVPYEEGNEIVALLFGSLRENKGIHLGIRAVQNMRANGHPLKLVIAGEAGRLDKDYWRWCKKLIEASPEGITVIDRYIENEELKEVVAGAHFFLLPYTEFHSQSGVAALALSNGRPIVATRAGGLSDVLLPDRTGVFIEGATVKSVEEALLRAVRLGHNGLRKMGQQAFEVYNASYSWDAIAQTNIDLYRQLKTRPESKVL